MQEGADKKRYIWAAVALVVGVALGVLVARGMTQSTTTDATAESASATEATEATQDSADTKAMLASWDTEGEAYQRLTSFVEGVVDPASDEYLPPEERVATFDMDGTFLCEKGPIYIDQTFSLWHVLHDDTYEAPADVKAAVASVEQSVYAGVVPKDPNLNEVLAASYTGHTPDELMDDIIRFASTNDVAGFEGMTYAESFYQPMVEVIKYLRANDFEVYVVSACERYVARALAVNYVGFDPSHVIASDLATAATDQGDEDAVDYTFSQTDEVLISGKEIWESAKTHKVFEIANEIGRRPVLAFGNSSGDYAMLNYATANPDHEGLGFLVLCDDTVREYGDLDRVASQTEDVEREGWVAISMANDWTTIYGEGVERTELPAALPEAA